ncbi:sugar ABC transporter permease [Dactylosporangium aurantiacum]|uniref:Sugar ABC transporter permease n=1 Tax=Dactylosporangium aurantiacum TaxID=35754 RepID=A0A9Q9IJ54_9ACTN|nr:sugar ABC transporter permease [Dactylosporangium aurantiacum]MDG6105598.1 sugar ABC transporter permease [Dactylosporangium aurantiacum]UWZ57062.1 sugar ABC transporter permease [Dactylosporangium aurantiacum]
MSRRRLGPRARRQRLGLLLVAPAVVLVLGMFVLPVVVTAVMSLYDWSLLGQRRFVGLANYRRLAGDGAFLDSLGFTTVYTVIVTAALFVVGVALASAVRHRRPGVGLLRTAYVMPVVIGFATASYLTLWLLDDRIGIVPDLLRRLGVVDGPVSVFSHYGTALTVVVVLVVWKTVGLTMLLLMTGMQAISKDYYEAAQVDGATRARVLRSVTLPLLRPTIALVLILTVIGSYLAFDQFFILTQGGPDNSTIPVVYLIYRAGFIDFNLGYSAAMSIALMGILLVLTSIQLLVLRAGEDR